jgi:protein transport protein SEC13
MIHDTKMDYYGTRLATCSSDRTCKVYTVSNSTNTLSATLSGHAGPVWSCDWAHPRFGVLLATCSFDGTILIHREVSANKYATIYKHSNMSNTAAQTSSSVNHVAFAPSEHGLLLAAVAADGTVTVLSHNADDTWTTTTVQDCNLGVNSVTWRPFVSGQPAMLATGGCDSRIRLWCHNVDTNTWAEDRSLGNGGHNDWVRDVAWCPVIGPSNVNDCIASCGEDGQVFLWVKQGDVYIPTLIVQYPNPCYRVTFSVTGNILAVSSGESDVALWKRGVGGEWGRVVDVEDTLVTKEGGEEAM